LEVSSSPVAEQEAMFGVRDFATVAQPFVSQTATFSSTQQEDLWDEEIGEYKVIGQLWNAYIILESSDALYYIDQHALAERILFEKIKA
jgi:DNA mismatch repair ATPase MutL